MCILHCAVQTRQPDVAGLCCQVAGYASTGRRAFLRKQTLAQTLFTNTDAKGRESSALLYSYLL